MFKSFLSALFGEASDRIGTTTSNVRGATGLSGAELTRMVASDGLFGRDSAFAVPDQRAILAQLGVPYLWREGRASKRAIPVPTFALRALRTFVEQATCGEGTVSRAEWRAADTGGLTSEQCGEVLAVVGLLDATLGLVRGPVAGDAQVTAVAVSDASNLSRAA
jgi:hypothetical protein